MRKIRFTAHILPHIIAILTFFLITVFFFNPVFFENKRIGQHDIRMWEASSKSLRDFREQTGEEGLWTPSMFSGMPAYLVNVHWSNESVIFLKKILTLSLPHPVNNIMAAFVCYYLLLLTFRVRPYLAISGAIAFGLSSFMIIGLSAGHNARIGAMAFMPLVMAGIHLAFSNKRLLGFGVTAAGLSMHLRENHLQITYYLLLIVLGYGLVQLVDAIRKKQLPGFLKNIGVLIPAVLIASGTVIGQFWAITEYTTYSIRGKSELENPSLQGQEEGLTKSYAFQYNYGIWEPMTLLIPEFYGGSSRNSLISDPESEVYQALVQQAGDQQTANQLAQYATAYWGPQRGGTIGPYYAGAIVCFLFVIGIVYANRKYVWWLLPLSVFAIFLSWGDSFPSFNYFMFDYLPGYNKFRSFNFALIIILFAMPLMGLIGLENLLTNGFNKNTLKKFLWPVGIIGGICLILAVTGGFGDFLRDFEEQLPPWFVNALQEERSDLLQSDAWRSFWFIVLFAGIIYLRLKNWIKDPVLFIGAAALVTADLAFVDKRYFTKENFVRKTATSFTATPADEEIRKDKSYYRVYNLQSPFSTDATASYFHYDIGGYHGAKLRRYQDLYDSCLSRQTNRFINDAQRGSIDFQSYSVLNMLNVKYIIYGPERNNVITNPEANGAAWFVKDIERVNSPTEELERVCEVNTERTAVINVAENPVSDLSTDSTGQISIVEHAPNYLKYESQSSSAGLAVFSEIYYPKGWKATIDGEPADILRANYVLRALTIPAGKHTIEFRFEPAAYVIGNKITLASSWLLLLIVAGCLGWSVKTTLKDSHT